MDKLGIAKLDQPATFTWSVTLHFEDQREGGLLERKRITSGGNRNKSSEIKTLEKGELA